MSSQTMVGMIALCLLCVRAQYITRCWNEPGTYRESDFSGGG